MGAGKAPPALFRLLLDLVRRPWVEDDEAALDAELIESEWLSAGELAARGEARLRRLMWRAFLDAPAWRAAWAGLDAARLYAEPPARLLASLPRAEGGEILDAALDAEEARRRAAFARRAFRWQPAGEPPRPSPSPGGATKGELVVEDARIGVIGAACSVSAPAVHVFSDHVLVEADGDALLASDLDSFAAPRLRQPLARRGRLLARGCPCGRALPLVVLT